MSYKAPKAPTALAHVPACACLPLHYVGEWFPKTMRCARFGSHLSATYCRTNTYQILVVGVLVMQREKFCKLARKNLDGHLIRHVNLGKAPLHMGQSAAGDQESSNQYPSQSLKVKMCKTTVEFTLVKRIQIESYVLETDCSRPEFTFNLQSKNSAL